MVVSMSAREWFERIRLNVTELEGLESKLEAMRGRTDPKGQRYDAIGHGSGNSDASAPILAVVHLESRIERQRAITELDIEYATQVLYGRHGRGGLARARTSADADCICGYYLQAMTWREVAEELVRPDSRDGPQWCKRRAYRALAWMDGVDVTELRETG